MNMLNSEGKSSCVKNDSGVYVIGKEQVEQINRTTVTTSTGYTTRRPTSPTDLEKSDTILFSTPSLIGVCRLTHICQRLKKKTFFLSVFTCVIFFFFYGSKT